MKADRHKELFDGSQMGGRMGGQVKKEEGIEMYVLKVTKMVTGL